MAHFRQDPLIEKHLLATNGEFTHTFKGKEYIINSEKIEDYDEDLIQSLSTRLSKLYPKKKVVPKQRISRGGGKTEKGAPGLDDRTVVKITKEILIERELKRLATTEFLVEDKLHYPRVFMKLLSQPHLALEEKRLVVDEKVELYLYVDTAVGYNDNDDGFHHTLIQVAKKIKGIHVFYSEILRFRLNGKHVYYWEHLKKNVPKGKKVLVFTQGCGGTEGVPPKGYDIHFCTHFSKGCTCGCDTIPRHESFDKIFKVYYDIYQPEQLKKLVIK